MKTKTSYICQSCGYVAAKWMGQCPSCGQWNIFSEEVVRKDKKEGIKIFGRNESMLTRPVAVQDIKEENFVRIPVPGKELTRVLGGGLVPGSVTLFAGEPGIGKSTLMLQLALRMKNLKVLYVSGEESVEQIKMRARRIGITNEQCFLYNETNLQSIFHHISELQPGIIIIDSIQTLYSSELESAPSTISQIRECTAALVRVAKTTHIPVFIIGHITKDGSIAGPKVLEHMVDTVLQFEGDRNYFYRLLRVLKNRFGSTQEIGLYEMAEHGLKEVDNPSGILLSQWEEIPPGVCVGVTMEGQHSLLVETQALVNDTHYGNPQRVTKGYDNRKLALLLAVLEKKCGITLADKDVFVNLTGGFMMEDTSLDLAVCTSILGSYHSISVHRHICFSGEVGLTGEIRPVSRLEQRIAEAEKMGFKEMYISSYHNIDVKSKSRIELKKVQSVEKLYHAFFG
ncbi:MAG: DNA repair protein RadA [Bacteroidia bacterium]|nr:DNA repair protein RadA [Bacteroidia bacterium]